MIRKSSGVAALFFAVLLVATGCKSEFEALVAGYDTEAKYAAAFEYFNAGKYTKAARLFESLSIISSGTMQDDTIQYYWGLSNYRDKDYYTAQTNFENFLSTFPRSPFAASAEYLNIDCLYKQTLRYELDQAPTYRALTAINLFIASHPGTPEASSCDAMRTELEFRLDKKAYENAYLYYKMEDYKASSVALRNVLKENADNVFREDILFYTAMSSYKYALNSIESKKKDRYLTFVDDYYNFIGEYPESKHRKELDNCFRKVKDK